MEESPGGDIGDDGEIEMRDRWISVKRELGVCADEDGLTPAYVGIKGDKQALVLAAILAASARDSKDAVLPVRIDNSRAAWHAPAGLEFFVDFEFCSDLDDDLSNLPNKGGQPCTFMIGVDT